MKIKVLTSLLSSSQRAAVLQCLYLGMKERNVQTLPSTYFKDVLTQKCICQQDVKKNS